MLEFKVTLDTDDDILKITGPTDFEIKGTIWSIDDMCKMFKEYMLTFCQKVYFGDYRIDAITNNNKSVYSLSKDQQGTRSTWVELGKFSTYFDAFETMCNYQYQDMQCPAGFTDCIFADKDCDLCKECAKHNGCYYDDEDK